MNEFGMSQSQSQSQNGSMQKMHQMMLVDENKLAKRQKKGRELSKHIREKLMQQCLRSSERVNMKREAEGEPRVAPEKESYKLLMPGYVDEETGEQVEPVEYLARLIPKQSKPARHVDVFASLAVGEGWLPNEEEAIECWKMMQKIASECRRRICDPNDPSRCEYTIRLRQVPKRSGRKAKAKASLSRHAQPATVAQTASDATESMPSGSDLAAISAVGNSEQEPASSEGVLVESDSAVQQEPLASLSQILKKEEGGGVESEHGPMLQLLPLPIPLSQTQSQSIHTEQVQQNLIYGNGIGGETPDAGYDVNAPLTQTSFDQFHPYQTLLPTPGLSLSQMSSMSQPLPVLVDEKKEEKQSSVISLSQPVPVRMDTPDRQDEKNATIHPKPVVWSWSDKYAARQKRRQRLEMEEPNKKQRLTPLAFSQGIRSE